LRTFRHGRRALSRVAPPPNTPQPGSQSLQVVRLVEQGHAWQAENLLKALVEQGGKLHEAAFAAVMQHRVRDGRDVTYWFEAMGKAGLTPNVTHYTIAISSLGKRGLASDAEQWFSKMQEEGITPDIACCNSILHAWARLGDVERCKKWMASILEAGLTPDIVSYNSMLHAHATQGDAERAEELLRSMGEVRPNARTFTAVLSAFARSGDVEGVTRVMQFAAELGVPADVIMLTAVLGAFARCGDVEGARAAFRAFRAQGVQPDARAFSTLAQVHAGIGQPEAFPAILEEQQAAGVVPSSYFFAVWLEAHRTTGNSDLDAEARAVLRLAVEHTAIDRGVALALVRAVGREHATLVMREEADADVEVVMGANKRRGKR